MTRSPISNFFFFNDTATTEIYTLSLHDALPIYDERLKPAGQLLAHGAALSGLDRAQVLVEDEDFGVVGGDEEGAGERCGADHDRQVAGLEAPGVADERAVRLEAPVGRLALRRAQRAVLHPPAREGGQP